MRMTDATLPALSSPTPDAAPPLSAMDCATEEEPSQSTSNMTDSSQSSGSVSGGPFCDLTGAQLLKHCNSGMLESPECLKLKEIPYSNDIHASASGIENVAFNLSNQKLVEEIPSLKSSPASQVTLCSNEAFCAKKHTGEMVEAQLNMRSSVEANHLQLPVLPKLDASSKSSAVNVDLLEKQILLTEQLPVSVETKEDPLSMDSSASTKSINSLSCDEASSKDSLLTSTESKSVGSPPEADLTSSTEVKEFYEASKTEAIEPKCNKTKVSSLSGVDCVKPFVVAADETDSGCPSDSDGMALHNSYDEVSTEKTATLKKVGIGAPSGSLISVTLSDVNLSSAFNPSTSSNSLNLGASASTSDGSHTCDTSEKTVEGSISSSSVVMADVHQNRTEGIHMQDGALTQKENKIFSGLECMKAASALGTSGDESLSTGSHVESSEDKSLQSKMGQKKSECQSQSSSLCDAAGTAMQVAEFTTSSTHCDPATINKFSTIDDEIHPKYQMKPLPQPHVNLQGSKSESVKFTVTGCVQTTHGGSIPKEKVSISESDCAVGAIKEGTSLGNIKSDEMMEVAQSQNVTADEDDLKVKDSETGSIECSLASPEKCVPISTAECATESLQGICDEMSIGCKKSESSSSMKVGQLLNCAREMGSKNEETADSCGQLQVDVSSQNLEADECTEVSESCGALGESQKPHLTRLLCSDNSSSTNKSVDTAMLATECSLNIGGKLGCALLSSTSSSTEPDTNTSESKHAPESLAVTETSVKFHLSTEVESAGVLESRGDVQISITQNDAPESAFKNEVSPAYEANFSNEVESSVSKSCGSVCPTPSTTLSTNELATTEVDVAAAPDITECSSTAETSKIAHETTGQVLKIEHAESLKEESSSADATDVNLDQELKASEHSDLPSRGPVNAASGDMVIDKKIEMGCVVSEDVICSKQTTESGKTFPSVDVSCDSGDVVLQTVVGGVLQTLDVAALEARKKEEEDSDHRKLFAGVDDELTGASDALSRNTAMHVLENNAGEMDGIGGLVINSVVGAFGEGVDEYADGESAAEADSSNKDLADISSSYHAMNKDIDSQQPECDDRPRSKRPRLEGAESEVRRPVFLRVKPVKGKSESFWDSPKLRTALAEKGTVLLRLCTVEPTEDFDSPADFVGVMLECCEDAGYGGHMTDRHNSPDMYSVGVDGGYHPGVYNHYGYVSRTPAGGDEDFVETEEVEESMDYDGTGHTLDWQGKKVPSAYGARQSMPPPHVPHGAYYIPPPPGISPVSPPFMRGKRKHGMRGRPPVHVRSVYHMVAPAPTPASLTAVAGAAAHRASIGATVAPSYPPHHYYSLPPPYASPAAHSTVGTSPSSALTPVKGIKVLSASAKHADGKASDIVFRPPTPPLVTDAPKSAVLAAGSLRRCSSLLSVRRPAPGSILSQQMKLLYKEDSSDDTNARTTLSVRSKPAANKSSSATKKSPTKKTKIGCDFCSSKFRKRTALLAHVKHKHRLMKKCPICNVGVRVKGKYNMKFHILKNHKEINNFACGDCGAVFKLQHHLKNHIRLGCEPPEVKEQSVAPAVIGDAEMSLTEADILVPSTAEVLRGDAQTSDRELELLGYEAPTDKFQARLSERKNSGEDGFDDRPDATISSSDTNASSAPANVSKRKRSCSRHSESNSDVEDRKKDKIFRTKGEVIAKPSCKRQKVASSNDCVSEQETSARAEETKIDVDKSQSDAKIRCELPRSKSSVAAKPTVDKCDRRDLGRPKNKFDLNPSIDHGDSDMDKADSSEGESNSFGAKPKATKILKKRGRKPKLKSAGHAESSDESDHERNSTSTEMQGKAAKDAPAKNDASSKVQRDHSRERKSPCPKVSSDEPDNQSRIKKSSTRFRHSGASNVSCGESDADHRPHLRGDHPSKLPVHRHSSDSCKTGSGSECDKSDWKEISASSTKSLRSKMSSPTRMSRRVKVEEEIKPKSIKAQTILKRLKIDNGRSSRSNSEAGGSSSDSEIEEEKRFFCKLCDAGFSHAFKLRHHRREIHNGSESGSVPSNLKEANKSDTDQSIKFSCSQCEKHCRNAYQLRLHMLTHSSSESQSKPVKKPLGRPPKDRTKILQKVGEDQLMPRLEKNPTENKNNSPEELSTPGAEDPPSSISSSIRSSSSLNQLPSYIIKKARIFICTKCSLSFKREKSVTYHMKKIHETLYPFKACPHCSRVFRSCGPYHKHLKLHNIRHCPVEGCKARYRAFRKMKQHQKASHEDYPHRCASCEQLYEHQHELDEHTKVTHVKHEPEDEDEEDDASEGEQQLEEDTGETNEQESSKKKEEKDVGEEKSRLTSIDKLEIENLPNKRRTRTELSYKEEEEEDLLLMKKKRPLPIVNKSPFKRKIGFTRSPCKTSSEGLGRGKGKRINEVEKLKKTDFDIFKRNEELDRSSRRRTVEEPLPVVIKPKNVVKKKKISMSWTAALKARIKAEARAAATGKPLKVNRPKTPKSSPTVKTTKTTSVTKSQKSPGSVKSPGGVKSPKSPPSVKPPKSPAVAAIEAVKVPQSPSEIIANENLAALVVRRVAETLASQEVADLKVPGVVEAYTPTTPSPASSAPPPPPTPPPTAPTPPSIAHPQHFGAYPSPYPFPPHYYGYPHPPPPMYHPHHHPYPPYPAPQPHFHQPGYHPPYAGSEDSCSSVDTHQDNSSNSTDRPDSPNKVLRFDNF